MLDFQLSEQFPILIRSLMVWIEWMSARISARADEYFFFYFLQYYLKEKRNKIVKFFNFQFLIHLHDLGCPEHDFGIFSVFFFDSVYYKFYGRASAKTYAWNLVSSYYELLLIRFWRISLKIFHKFVRKWWFL